MKFKLKINERKKGKHSWLSRDSHRGQRHRKHLAYPIDHASVTHPNDQIFII